MKILNLLLALLIFTILWIGLIIKSGIKELPKMDCQFMIPAIQYQLTEKIEELKQVELNDYEVGWNDALKSVLYLLREITI